MICLSDAENNIKSHKSCKYLQLTSRNWLHASYDTFVVEKGESATKNGFPFDYEAPEKIFQRFYTPTASMSCWRDEPSIPLVVGTSEVDLKNQRIILGCVFGFGCAQFQYERDIC